MIIKKFTAPTMTEALARVREELGVNAIILSTRSQKRGGVLDFAGKSLVEVTAAVDDAPLDEKKAAHRRTTVSPIGPDEAAQYPPKNPVSYEPPPRASLPNTRPSREVEMKDLENRLETDRLAEDIRELKRSIKVLADTTALGTMDGLPPQLRTLLFAMQQNGMDDRIAKRLIRQLLNELTGLEMADSRVVMNKATDILAAGMGDTSPILLTGTRPRVVAFVGPTGSGKTTTIAKLAADFTLNHGKKVSVLTTDTKRVDAVGQLKAYCRIINVPLFIAYSPEELPGIMPGIMPSDITLVDTPGSGPMDKAQLRETVEFLGRLVPQEVHLAMSVTTALMEMKRVYDNFGVLKPNRLLFTKLDETDRYGTLLSFAVLSKKPMSYVTFGQNVPGDFSLADKKDLIRKAMERPAEGEELAAPDLL